MFMLHYHRQCVRCDNRQKEKNATTPARERPMDRLATQWDHHGGGGVDSAVAAPGWLGEHLRTSLRKVGRKWRPGMFSFLPDCTNQWESLDFNPDLPTVKLYALHLLLGFSFSRFEFSKLPWKWPGLYRKEGRAPCVLHLLPCLRLTLLTVWRVCSRAAFSTRTNHLRRRVCPSLAPQNGCACRGQGSGMCCALWDPPGWGFGNQNTPRFRSNRMYWQPALWVSEPCVWRRLSTGTELPCPGREQSPWLWRGWQECQELPLAHLCFCSTCICWCPATTAWKIWGCPGLSPAGIALEWLWASHFKIRRV